MFCVTDTPKYIPEKILNKSFHLFSKLLKTASITNNPKLMRLWQETYRCNMSGKLLLSGKMNSRLL